MIANETKRSGSRGGVVQAERPAYPTPATTSHGPKRLVKPAGEACLGCPLREAECVRTECYPNPKFAIVGEAPGRNEVEEGRPFIGKSGSQLVRLLRKQGFSREDVLWSNAALCGVPKTEKDLRIAAKLCRDRLQRDLEGVPLVVAVGAHSLHNVLGLSRKPKILEWRGFVVRRPGRIVLPTIHPAFNMRSPSRAWTPVIETDFERIGRIVSSGWMPPEKLDGRKRVVVHTIGALQRELSSFDRVVAIDVETTEEPAWKNKLVCLSVTGASAKRTVVVPWSTALDGTGSWFGGKEQLVGRLLTAFLRDRVAITHNGPAFDHVVLARYGIFVDQWEDTLLAHHAFASHMPQRLSHVVSMYEDVEPWKEQEHESLRDLWTYNSQDTLYTVLAWRDMQGDLEVDRRVYETDKKTADLGRAMQENGIRFDKQHAVAVARELRAAMQRAGERASRAVGYEVPLRGKGSNKILRAAFFETLEAPIFFRSDKTGKAALNVDALRAYACYADERLRDLANAVLDFRKAFKAVSTYITPIETDAEDRVHPSWHNFGTVTGRFACRAPNLMNLHRPANDPAIRLGGIRSLYTAAFGNVLCAFDARQLEMRVAAYASGDEAMIAACESEDLHAANAELLFESFASADKDERKKLRDIAKQSGFAVAYMAAAPTVFARIVAAGIPITLAQVEAMLRKMRRKFAGYYRWQDDRFHEVIRTGYVMTPILGRKRWVGHAPKPTETSNFPIQGGAADHMNALLPRLVASLPREAKLVAQIHDAAIFDVPEQLADGVSKIIRQVTEEPVKICGRKVVFPIDLKVGGRWSEV